MANDALKFSGKLPELNKDYVETQDTFTIFNVPILAEMVQFYELEGNALKSVDEISKVKVEGVPLTIVDDAPTHPEHLSGLNTLQKADVVVGFMSEPSQPKENMSKNKRYADFVLYNTPKIDALKTLYLSGAFIDTSIGFNFRKDETPGEWFGLKYDFIQRDIVLDHNAILIDRVGNLGVGRMPSPIGGIGADSQDKNNGGIKVADDAQKTIEELKASNDAMRAELEKYKSADAESKIKALDEELGKVKVELKDAKDELESTKAKLKGYTDKEAEILASKREELKKHYADVADLFDKADASYINAKFDELEAKKKKSKDISTDMFGVNKNASEFKSEKERFDKVYGKKE